MSALWKFIGIKNLQLGHKRPSPLTWVENFRPFINRWAEISARHTELKFALFNQKLFFIRVS